MIAVPGCLKVDLFRVTWAHGHAYQDEIRNYFKSQGFAEAEPLPYKPINPYQPLEGIEVCRSLPEWGWEIAVYVNGIPF